MIATFVLILHLQGAIEIEIMPNLFTCIVKAQLMMKRDDVLGTSCMPSMEYDT